MRAAVFLALSISLLSDTQSPAWGAVNPSPSAGNAAGIQLSNAAGTNTASDQGGQAEGATDAYPRVTAIENTILGQTFAYEPLPTRLERMEKKAFGKPSQSDDLGERTDALYDYAQNVLHKNPFASEYSSDAAADQRLDGGDSDGGSSAGSSATGGSSGGASDYPHVTALEKAILGQTYTSDQLADRLSRMESKAFGSPATAQDLSDRTDALEKYAEKKLHMKPYGAEERAAMDSASPGGPGQSGSRGQGVSKLAAVGNTILNMAGLGMMGGGMGMPGFGGMPGVGGVNVRQRTVPTADQTMEAQKIQQQLEDPLLKASTPPPSSAKLLTKVGWCEIQVFGQTAATSHLLDRLNNLNQTLSFDPGKKGVDLMDHIDELVKLAQAKRSPQSVGALAPNKVQ